jgi:membrane protease YdiL (CAAX protease family)
VALWRATAHGISAAQLGLAVPNLALTLVIASVLGAFVFANQVFSLRRLALRPEEIKGTLPQLALKIFPQDNVERLVFFALVVTVAVCEELIYRGFAQRVFENWSGGYVVAGIAESAALFGLAHLYQGRRGLAATFVVGLIFSGVRSWTGSLLAPLIAHFVTDMTAGLLAPPRLKQALSRSATKTSQSESVA